MEENKRKMRKKLVIGALSLATIVGTFTSHEEDFPPFKINKTGTSYGIAVGGEINFEEGAKFYGIVIAPVVNISENSEIYGANICFINLNAGKLNGLSLGLGNVSHNGRVNGLELGITNAPHENSTKTYESSNINGVQIGVLNNKRNSTALQIGIANLSDGGDGLQLGFLNSVKKEYGKYQLSLIINPYDSKK